MTPFIAALVLVSAGLHPIWNMLLKKSGDPRLGYLALTATLSFCGLIHGLVAGDDFMAAWLLWPLLLVSWCGQVIYGTCLTATLRRGDLSTYYPIIRASPVFIVIVSVLFLGQHYAWLTLAGIGLAVAGGFLLLYRRGTRFLEDPLTLGFALLAMVGTGIYSLADARLMQSISPQVQMFWIEGLLVPLFAVLYWRSRSTETTERAAITATGVMWIIVPGILAYTSYYLILMAYQMGGEVAAVTSVRQASIPLSVILGGYFLREGAILRRLAAASLLALGIIAIVATG